MINLNDHQLIGTTSEILDLYLGESINPFDDYDESKSHSYMSNIKLKGINAPIVFTSYETQEFEKCANDIHYFVKNYIKIVTLDKGLIGIDPYDYQSKIIDMVQKNRYVIVNTSRQAGKTTIACAIILHYILFNKHKTVALLANKGDSAREILERVKLAYEELPKWMQHGIVEWNKGNVELENGCKVLAGSTSSSSIRGKSIPLLYIDEAAFVEGWDEFFASVFPTISSGQTTKIFMTSTPNGMNHFYKTWMGAVEQRNGYKYLEVPWNEVPGRDEKWKKEIIEGLDGDMDKFAQEFCCEFMGSSGTLIAGHKLKELVFKEPVYQNNDGLKIYKQPEEGRTYAIVVDTSEGVGQDNSAFQVIDITKMPYEQVCTFKDNIITPIDYAGTVYRVGKMYNDAHALIELNSVGGQVSESLWNDYEYENILMTESAGRAGKRITSGFMGKQLDKGVKTTKTTKSIGCSVLKMLIEQNQLIINDFDTINELSTFSKRRTSYEAEPGHHDDLVMGLVLFAWLSDQLYFKDLTDINTLHMLRKKTEEQMENELLPFFVDDGNDHIPQWEDDGLVLR